MQLKYLRSKNYTPIKPTILIIISLVLFILTGCSDPSHPEAIKILKQIESELKIKGQVNLSELSEQFDEICSIIQDDSDDGYTIYLMNKILLEKSVTLSSEGVKIPENPQTVILFIKNNKGIAAYDWAFNLNEFKSPLLFEDYQEKFVKCGKSNRLISVNYNKRFNKKLIELR